MGVNIKKKLMTKKADRCLTQNVKSYISSFEDARYAAIVLKMAYADASKYGKADIDRLKKSVGYLLSLYIPKNEVSKKQPYLLLSRMADVYISGYSTETMLKNIASIDYMNQYSLSIKEEQLAVKIVWAESNLIFYSVDGSTIKLIVEDIAETHRINNDAETKVQCKSVYNLLRIIIYDNSLFYREKLKKIKELISSEFIQSVLTRHTHISCEGFSDMLGRRKGLNFINRINVMNCLIDEYGFISLSEKESNYYKDMALKFIENNSERNEADEEYVYKTTISKAKEYDMSSVAEDIIFKIPATILFLKVGQKNVVLDITLSDFTLRHVENGISRYKEYGYQKKYTFFAYIKNEIYLQHNGRVRPAVLNDLVCAQKGCREVREIIKKWIEHEIPNNQFYKDFLTLFLESCDYGYALMPVTLIDIAKNHNWNEYFNNKYKTAGSLGVNFNRYKPYVSYVFIKCSKYIEFSKRQLFLQTLNEHPEFTKLCKKDREKVKEVIKNYYTHRLRLSEEKDKDEYLILNDWISMCMRLKIPIPLKKNSIKKIHELHDEITQENWVMEHAKEKDQIIVKEDSVFNELRQILPISFEWIKTRKRLFMESSMQHHCVWSYEEYIVDDKSAIYSYVCAETGCRHTIEFIYNENKYIVSQIQKNYDKGCDIQVIETLRKYLGAEAVQDI